MAKLSSLSPTNNLIITTNSRAISALVGSVQTSPCTVYLEVSTAKDFSTLFYSTNVSVASGGTANFTVSNLLQGNYYWRMKVKDGAVTSNYTAYRGLFVNIPSTVTGRLAPDAILEQTNLTGSLANIQDDPDTPDANWLTANADTDSIARVSFPTPTGTLSSGSGIQNFRVRVRSSNTGSASSGTVALQLYENGVLKTQTSLTLAGTSAGTVLQYAWDAASLGGSSNVECRVVGTGVYGGNAANKFRVEIGAIEWNYQAASPTESQSLAPTDVAPWPVADLLSAAAVDYTRLSWIEPFHDDFSHVVVYKDNVIIDDFHIETMFTDTNVAPNTSYVYKVVAYDMAGNASTEVSKTVVTPITPVVPTPEPTPSKAPVFSLVSVSAQKISDEPTKDISNVTFKFDMDVIAWKVKVLGTSHDTGVLIASGDVVLKDTEIVTQIDWTELQAEGSNRINIYGFTGAYWTPYNDASVLLPRKYEYGVHNFGLYNYGKH